MINAVVQGVLGHNWSLSVNGLLRSASHRFLTPGQDS